MTAFINRSLRDHRDPVAAGAENSELEFASFDMSLPFLYALLRISLPIVRAAKSILTCDTDNKSLRAAATRYYSIRNLEGLLQLLAVKIAVLGRLRCIPAPFVTTTNVLMTGPYLRAHAAAHYRWARTRIRRWLRAQVKGATSRPK
jgi:hypothetical protein